MLARLPRALRPAIALILATLLGGCHYHVAYHGGGGHLSYKAYPYHPHGGGHHHRHRHGQRHGHGPW
jgi:hypothetical protein